MSTAMGAQIAERLTNRSASFDMPITRLQPIALHAWWPLAVRGAIALGRSRDFLGL